MKYTIKQLAENSGVSTRTLRYYDQIGLLSPMHYTANGYRVYGEPQLLLLQQILFFRELGFKLEDIQEIVTSNEFDQLQALQNHKENLLQKIINFKKLVKTIDKTISHIKGEIKITETDLYLGFKHPKQQALVDYLEKNMSCNPGRIIDECRASIKKLAPNDFRAMKHEAHDWCLLLKAAIEKRLSPSSKKVQTLIEQYYQRRIKKFCNPTPEELVALIKAESHYPEYKKRFAEIHHNFSEFLLSAVTYFAKNTLNKKSSK
ncbi:MAG: hypothetical protein A3F18_00890 [Legionellales bacterium RIFCSPHIGHO2_12_FULL_37_14]|nr:MAG: hypothetical protein A3F18_00890 [Legionellales bacterium RIFCSPHIGHO2_12_FULL_37_14]